MSAKKTSRRKARPLGIALLAILQILAGIQYISVGLLFLTLASSPANDNKAALQLFLGIAFIGLGILCLRLASGYLQGYEWARIRGRKVAAFAIALAILGVLMLPTFLTPANPGWTIVFNAAIIVYLGRPKVRAFFRRSKKAR